MAMRLFWAGFLMTGLLLIGVSTYERSVAPDAPAAPTATSSRCEDGTGFPQPYPTPTPKP
jgi:hypothetical protein